MYHLPIKSKFQVTAVFGQTGKYWADGHKGIDIVSSDKNVRSVCDGTVRVIACDKNGWGNYITIGDAHGNIHVYCHLAQLPTLANKKVTAGQVIGVMGATGNVTGVHLHYQVNNAKGTPQNPALFLGIPNKIGEYNGDSLYKDDAKISPWAKEAVYYCKGQGKMVGDTEGNFNPKAPLTREEAAVIIYNASNK